MYKILPKKRLGELRIQKKIIVNEGNPNYLDVVIGEIELIRTSKGDVLHYIVNFGGNQGLRIIGKENWDKFIDMIQWLDWDPAETQEFYIGEEGEFHNQTLEYQQPWLDDDEEIIEGMPIDDDE